MENSDRLPRKLAAILYADVAGYSRLTGEDEDATHRRLSEYLDLISTSAQRYRGRVMHYAGDAVLAMFEAVVDALCCAAIVQRELEGRNEELAEDRRVRFRIGVNLGDVIEDRGDIYGDGVNIAARLTALAEPGGICVSESVRTAVGSKLPMDYRYLGEQAVKNIREPVKAYHARPPPGAKLPTPSPVRLNTTRRISNKAVARLAALSAVVIIGGVLTYLKPWQLREAPASIERMAYTLPEEPSIAVLPFDNLSDESEHDIFAEAISESIITALSQIQSLLVIDRNSTFTYKGKPVGARDVAEELGVRYVLGGSVQRSGNRVRVNAQLIDALTGRHVWAERYDREVKDIFSLQDDIAQNVVTEMEVNLTDGERARLQRSLTGNADAYVHASRGWMYFRRFTKKDNPLARLEFERSLAIDPQYPVALAGIAWTHWADARYRWSRSREKSLKVVEAIAEQIFNIDNASMAAYDLWSAAALLKRDFERSIIQRKRAIELNPNNSANHFLMAFALNLAGRPDEAIEFANRAIRLSPFSPPPYWSQLGDAYRLSGRLDEAIDVFKSIAERNPNDVMLGRVRLAASLAAAGREEEAKAVAAEILQIEPGFSLKVYEKSRLYKDPDVTRRLISDLKLAGLPD